MDDDRIAAFRAALLRDPNDLVWADSLRGSSMRDGLAKRLRG